MVRWRSPDFLLVICLVLLAVCLLGVVYAQHRYSLAQGVYENHLRNVVITPHNNVKAELAAEIQAVNHWLHLRTIAGALAAVAIVGVLWQVVRRRNERVAVARADRSSELSQ